MRAILAVSLLLLPTPAFAAPPSGAKVERPREKKICRVDPEDTESRIRRRICKTESEWKGATGEKDRDAGTNSVSSNDND